MTENKTLEKRVRKINFLLKLFWLGTFFSFAIYLFVVYNVLNNPQEHSSPQKLNEDVMTVLTAVFSGIALISIIFSFVIKYLFTSRTALKNIFQGKLSFIIKRILPELKSKEDEGFNSEENILFYLKKVLVFHLIAWGCIQNCAIFGMALSLISKSYVYAVTGAVFSGIIQFIHFPSFKYDVEIILSEAKE